LSECGYAGAKGIGVMHGLRRLGCGLEIDEPSFVREVRLLQADKKQEDAGEESFKSLKVQCSISGGKGLLLESYLWTGGLFACLEENFGLGELELLGVVLVEEGLEVGAAAGFVEAGGAYDDELLGLAEALGVDGGCSADHADGGELGDFVGEGHEDGDGAEGLVGEGGVEAGEDDALAEVHELKGERNDVGVEELDLIDADDVGLVDTAGAEELFAEAVAAGGDGRGVVSQRRMAGDGAAVIAEVDVGLEAGDALTGDAGAF